MVSLMETSDAGVWAREFCRLFPDGPDEETMFGWFANAIQRGAWDVSAEIQQRNTEMERLLNRPYIAEFQTAVQREAGHQKLRWGNQHDLNKTNDEIFAVAVRLLGKALDASWSRDKEKTLHHIVTAAAVLANWHELLMQDEGYAAAAFEHDQRQSA